MKHFPTLPAPVALLLVLCCGAASAAAPAQPAAASGHYLLVWAGDHDKKGNDFLAVIDADPSSASYGHLLTTEVAPVFRTWV